RDPSPAVWLGTVGNHDLDLAVSPVGPGEVPAFPVREDRAHEVQVLRHGLLLQPSHPQRLAVIEIGAAAPHLAVAKVDDERCRRFDRDAASSTATHDPTEYEHTVAE